MDIKQTESAERLRSLISQQTQKGSISFLGCFLINSAVQFTLADRNNDIIFITYEEDANISSAMSLRDISGPFERQTNYEEGVIDIELNETAQAVYITAALLLEVMKLKADLFAVLSKLLRGVRVLDLRN